MINQEKVSEENARFWDELCGSRFARLTGITDAGPQSLKKFDDWYLKFYPYLDRHIGFDSLIGKKVLEVGLGYGTVAQRLAEFGAEYSGLDIATGPVQMANHRLRQSGLNGLAVKGSVLEPPFAPESFDAIIAIGCLHHTDNLKAAIEQCRLLLRPGGGSHSWSITHTPTAGGCVHRWTPWNMHFRNLGGCGALSAQLHPGIVLRTTRAFPATGRRTPIGYQRNLWLSCVRSSPPSILGWKTST